MLSQSLKLLSVSVLVADKTKSMWGFCLLSMTAFSGHFLQSPCGHSVLLYISYWKSCILHFQSKKNYKDMICQQRFLLVFLKPRTTTGMDAMFVWNISPYFSLDFFNIIWGSSPSCSKFPVISQGVGPRGLFILFLPVFLHFIATDTCKSRQPYHLIIAQQCCEYFCICRFWNKKNVQHSVSHGTHRPTKKHTCFYEK